MADIQLGLSMADIKNALHNISTHALYISTQKLHYKYKL